jgi:hypothetical protein
MGNSGISLGTLFLVLFVTLKLVHVIDWPWIWVLCPLWIPLALFLFIFGVILLNAWLWNIINSRRFKKLIGSYQ